MVRQSKKIPVAISLALHIGGLSLLLYSGLDSYKETKTTAKNISVSIVSVSEFDAHTSKDPNPLIHKLKFSNSQDISKSAYKDPIFNRIFESNSEAVTFGKSRMLRNPAARSDEFKRRDSVLKQPVMDKITIGTNMVSETLIGFEEERVISEVSLPTKLLLKIGNSDLLNSIRDKKIQHHQEVRFIKPDVFDDVSRPAFETILNPIQEKVRSRKFELNESEVNGFKIAKLDTMKKFEIFAKVAVNQQSKNRIPIPNKIQKILTPKNINLNFTTVINQENKDFFNNDRSLQRPMLNDIHTQFSSPQSNQDLDLVRESLKKSTQSKETKVASVPKSALEEPISSSWGSAIEQTILSNLVFPKKAQNQLLTGKVHLKLEILSDGTIVSVLIRRSSGHAILDKAAKAAVINSLKLPAAPNNYPAKKFIFNLPVRFSV